jgi:hypothetical protein
MRSVLFLMSMFGFSMAAHGVSSGEHLAYLVGCINCHHQRPKEGMNAPPLLIAKTYSIAEFKTLLRRRHENGRDLLKSSIMGIVAVEQFSHMTDAEIESIYAFLTNEWTQARASTEEAKIPRLFGDKKGPVRCMPCTP